jgi:Flp pilus assembly pilin Flp
MMKRLWREDEGVLTFEWIVLLTLLVIGVIGGVAGIRDAIIHECQGVVGAMVALNQSYSVQNPLGVSVGSYTGSNDCNTSTAVGSAFNDSATYGVGRYNATIVPTSFATSGGSLCSVVDAPTAGQ